jgi:seryl-tRNA synthetase
MRIFHTLTIAAAILLASWAPAQAAQTARAKPQKPKVSVAALQAQIKKLTEERDDLQSRLTATEGLQEDLAAARQSRDLARQEADNSRKELDQMKAALSENQGSSDTILKELQKTKEDLEACQAANETLRTDLEAAKAKRDAPTGAGALVPITPEITPARPLNLGRITPKAKKIDRGVVVVNVLVSESGEVLDTRLLQGLPGHGEWIDKANATCVEQARRLVFDPARAADGITKVRVWQGVGFMVD